MLNAILESRRSVGQLVRPVPVFDGWKYPIMIALAFAKCLALIELQLQRLRHRCDFSFSIACDCNLSFSFSFVFGSVFDKWLVNKCN